MPRQDEDGVPHLSYFDWDTQTHFAWDGKSRLVQVSFGGAGEPVSDQFELKARTILEQKTHIGRWMEWFTQRCQNYLADKAADRVVDKAY